MNKKRILSLLTVGMLLATSSASALGYTGRQGMM